MPFRSLLVFTAVLAWAQQPPAVLRGLITDPSGRVVPGVSVEIKAEGGENGVKAVSDRRGEYRAEGMPAGSYVVSGAVEGFQPFQRIGIRLAAGEEMALDIRLEIRPLASILVVAKAPAREGDTQTRTRNYQEVLEIREVRESSSKDVGEAISRLDGVWKIRKGGIANDIVLRGFQQDNVNVLIDGVRIYGACPNNMDPSGFHADFAEVDRVEVVKGPWDVRNQGGLGGTVNIVSKAPENGLRFTPTFATGSFGYVNPSGVVSYTREKFSLLAGYSLRYSDPYRDGLGRPFTELANYNEAGLAQRAFDINTSWFRLGAEPRRKHHAGLAYTRQRGGLVLYPYLQMDARYDHADRLSGSYDIGGLAGLVRRVEMQGYFTQVRHWMTDEYRTSSAGAARPYGMATLAGTRTLGGRLEAEVFSGLTAGLETYRRNWNAVNTLRLAGQYTDQPMIPNVAATSTGGYAEYRRTILGRLTVTGAGRLDTGYSEARSSSLNPDVYWAYNGTRSRSRRDTYPSGNVWAAYSVNESLEVFGGLGHSARVPDPQERYLALRRMGSDWVGNPDLGPTKNTEVDLGASYRNRWFTLHPTVFYSSLADYIVVNNQAKINAVTFVMNPVARSYAAVPARIYGGELGYSFSPHPSLLLSGGISYSRGTQDPLPAKGILDRNLAEMPPLKSRAALRYGNRFLFLELESLAALAQDRVDTDLKELRTPGYGIWNLKGGVHTTKLRIAAGVDNLANRFYYEHLSYQRDPFRTGTKVPEPGRSVFLTATYAF